MGEYPTVWNEPVDLEVSTADEHIYLQLCESDHTVLGVCTLPCADFLPEMEGELDEVMYLREHSMRRNVLSTEDPKATGLKSGSLVFSLYATLPGMPLPEVMTSLRRG